MTTYELAGYLARRMVAEGYSEADAIDAEVMLLRHFAACRKRAALLDGPGYVRHILRNQVDESALSIGSLDRCQYVSPSTSEAER